jgi:hypothetical protein
MCINSNCACKSGNFGEIIFFEFKGYELLDLQAYYQEGDDWKPGKGITVGRELIPELKKALVAAEKADKAELAD